VYGGDGAPDVLIASDLDLGVSDSASTQPMVQAIEYTLRLHHFRAGRFRVAYQSCDDSTPQAGTWNVGKCQANAKSYTQTASVVGVIGTFNSGCAMFELPILNADPHHVVAMVSPTNDALGLTQAGPGTSSGEPNRYYPSGVRNYVRVYPTQALQSRADATLARRLRVHRAFVFLTDDSPPAVTAGYAFAAAARADGIDVIGPSAPKPGSDNYHRLVRSLQRRGVDGMFLAGVGQTAGGSDASSRLVRAVRRRFGQSLPIIADDGFLPADAQRGVVGPAAAGMYISGALVLDPARQLPAAGLAFVRRFSATQPQHVANLFTPYAAQATDVLLAAIAGSDGSRASVVKQLFRIRVRNGILGSFHFTPQGDVSVASFPIFQVPLTASRVSADRPYTVITATP
jgi:branched-chain amino acid transport system substrate-binding protein